MHLPPSSPPAAQLLPEQRQRLILTRLAAGGRVLAVDLARECGISDDTIRRDMRELAAAGLCERVYGGVLPRSAASGPISQRHDQDQARKLALAAAAVGLLRQDQLLLIDAGSTNTAIASLLPDDLGLTVVTNAPAIAAVLAGRRGIALVVIGGPVDWRSGASLGARAVRELNTLRADLCFLGVCALDPAGGASAFDCEESEFKRAAVAASASVAVAVSNAKLGTGAPFAVAGPGAIAHLIVEHDAAPASLAGVERERTRIHFAGPPRA
ncbi:MAG: DeoR/GlpR family DNA-binding transcription regulator [Pseudomonadota bacterium]